MLAQLLEAALRSFAPGSAVWLSLRVLRAQNPQAQMTAWTVVLMGSLSMPVLMRWITVTIPTYSPLSQVAPASASPATHNLTPLGLSRLCRLNRTRPNRRRMAAQSAPRMRSVIRYLIGRHTLQRLRSAADRNAAAKVP